MVFVEGSSMRHVILRKIQDLDNNKLILEVMVEDLNGEEPSNSSFSARKAKVSYKKRQYLVQKYQKSREDVLHPQYISYVMNGYFLYFI